MYRVLCPFDDLVQDPVRTFGLMLTEFGTIANHFGNVVIGMKNTFISINVLSKRN
jgi:hypothetical protein